MFELICLILHVLQCDYCTGAHYNVDAEIIHCAAKRDFGSIQIHGALVKRQMS